MKEVIFTAVLSALLTVSGSYFVMKSQLTAEQDYWLSRQKYEREQQLLDRQIQLLETFNSKFLKLDLLTSKLKMKTSSFQAELHLCYQAVASKSDSFKCKADGNVVLNASYEYRQAMHELSVTLQMLPVYFSNNVTSLVPELNTIIEDNYSAVDASLEKFDSERLERPMSEYFQRDMNSTTEFRSIREKLISAMLLDIQS
ncbi:hypothetical protein M5238_004451 [Vibrio vulnificus]|nr:hypothetical protein [Vibrio vulnificus]